MSLKYESTLNISKIYDQSLQNYISIENGPISGIFGLPDPESLAASVKDRFVGKGIVVSGGTAALDSAIEKKFAKKAKLLEANQRVLDGAIQYTIDQGWSEAEQPAKSTA